MEIAGRRPARRGRREKRWTIVYTSSSCGAPTKQEGSSLLLFLCLSISVPVPTPSRVPDLCSFTRRTLTTQKIVPESRNVRGALRHATCFIISFLFSRQISPVREKHHPHESFRRPHVQQRRVDRVVPGGRLPDFGLGG